MKVKKILCLLLSGITLITMAGCGLFGGKKSDSEVIEYTEYKLVENGRSDYKIVLPSEASYDEEMAASEMVELFAEATSVTLETVYETEVTYSDTAKLIFLGDTKYTQHTNVAVDEIPTDGFTVKTVGSNLFVLGKNAGVVYGVHEFLEKSFGFEYYIMDVYALDKNVKEAYMPKLNISDAPDIEYRSDGWNAETTVAGSYRTRTRSYNDAFIFKGHFCHNSFDWLPKDTYESAHSDWYADDGTQLCYTAHGNATELAAMQSVLLEGFKERVNYYFDMGDYRQAISFTQQDSEVGAWCSCATCKADIDTYGAQSASIIRFLNPVAKQFKAWLAETYPGHEVDIVFFAYQRSEKAPIKVVNGELVPTDESVVMEDNLAVWIAPIYGNYNYSINHVLNQGMHNLFKNWSVLSKNFYVWCYDTNFQRYMVWYDSFNALPDLYEYLGEYNVKYMFNQGQYNSGAKFTNFDVLKAALDYKLMWDADTDVEAFTDRFFKAWFGAASEDMRNYYDSFIAWSDKIKTEQNYSGNIMFTGYTKFHYPLENLQEWQGYIEDAYKSIEGLKTTDPDLYNDLYKRINAESLTVRFVLIMLHSLSFTADEVLAMKQSFKEDASELGFTRYAEGKLIDTLYASWEV